MYRLSEYLVFCLLLFIPVIAPAADEPPVEAVLLEILEVRASGASRKVSHRTIKVNFAALTSSDKPEGWSDLRGAAQAFFEAYNAQYLLTREDQEIAGFILESDVGTFHYTNGAETPAFFTLKARISGPAGWRVAGFLHTHPADEEKQEYFSEFDYQGMKATSRPYYLRTPRGDLRYMDQETIVKNPMGAAGVSHCPSPSPCLEPHPGAGT